MPVHGKRYLQAAERVERGRTYGPDEALTLVKELASAKFDETVEAAFRLGIDAKKTDQNVRGTCSLPHGTGKSVRVLAIAKGEKIQEAEAAGADFAGGDEMIVKISEGWLDFDAVVATPDMMGQVGGKLGRILGPRGLLPNPKSGTVGFNIADLVRALKAGRIEFRNDKGGVVHAPIGKASFDLTKLGENLLALKTAVEAAKPASAKGKFILNVTVSTTMGPGIRVSV
jgi:large subunit ribosomal protein L1